MSVKYEPVDREMATSLIGEGVHTGLRKGSNASDAPELWDAISQSETSAWPDALDYAMYCLDTMGYAVCKKVDE